MKAVVTDKNIFLYLFRDKHFNIHCTYIYVLLHIHKCYVNIIYLLTGGHNFYCVYTIMLTTTE